MTTFKPGSRELADRLQPPDAKLVICFCAAWCDTCKEYAPRLEALSTRHPDISVVWVDIEDHPDLLGDEDVENFPTILIQHGDTVRFLGTVLPHIEHLDRLIEAMESPGKPQATGLPDVRGLLRAMAQAH